MRAFANRPQHDRFVRAEVTIDQIDARTHALIADRCPRASATADARQTCRIRQPLDALAADMNAAISQLSADARGAVAVP